MIAAADAVRAVAVRVLETYGLDAGDVLGATLELNPYGVQVLNVRLVITAGALEALTFADDGDDVRSES